MPNPDTDPEDAIDPATLIRLGPEDEAGRWADEMRRSAAWALRRAEERLGVTLDAPPIVESLAPEAAFYERLGRKPHNLVAVAVAWENRVIINRAKYFGTGAADRRATLTHEFTHLILGRRIPGPIPRWLNEGLAMVVSDEAGMGYHTRLALAATFGGLIPIQELWAESRSVEEQELAYAQSLSATRFLLRTTGDPDDPAPLVRKLADPERGAPLRALLFDPHYLAAFDRRWRESVRSLWTIVAALTGGVILWIGLAGLLMMAYWRKQRMARAVEQRWTEEEAEWVDVGEEEELDGEDFWEEED